MENNLPDSFLTKIKQFDNAVFYCINSSSQRQAVGIVRNVSLIAENTLEFSLSHFPVLENSWNVFAGELHFYQKGLPFSMDVHGTAWLISPNELTVQFNVLQTDYFWRVDMKHYSLQDTLADFFSSTGLFFKKMLVTGF